MKRVWNTIAHKECLGGLYQYSMCRVLHDGSMVSVSAIFTQHSTRGERAVVLRIKRMRLADAVQRENDIHARRIKGLRV